MTQTVNYARGMSHKEGAPDMVGLRDRALIEPMVYSFARVSAVINMKASDYRKDGKKFQISFHEKGGKCHRLPVHHKAEEYIDEHLDAAGFVEDKKSPLWQSAGGRSGRLTEKAIAHRVLETRCAICFYPPDLLPNTSFASIQPSIFPELLPMRNRSLFRAKIWCNTMRKYSA